MATVNFTKSTGGGAALSADLDGTPLVFTAGAASVTVQTGSRHALHWNVAGPTGSTYTIKITSPVSVIYELMNTLDVSGIDAGTHYFTPL